MSPQTCPKSRTADLVPESWLLMIYRVPSDSSRARVAVWRDLKRLGGLYLQQATCVLPDRGYTRTGIARIRERVDELGGSSILLTLTDVDKDAEGQFVEGFRGQSAKEYAEIVEECEMTLVKEIEFERFRGNYTFEGVEEIRRGLEKLRRWLNKVESHDWMAAEGKGLARKKVDECEVLLEAFEVDVFERTGHSTAADDPT